MTQSRVYDFGALLTQGRTKTLASTVLSAGVYEGFVPTVTSGTELTFSAGALLLPNGILSVEDATTVITIPTPASAEEYTVVADHEDIQAVGGSAVTYSLQSGRLARSGQPNTNSLAIAWISHPGAAALDATMVKAPERSKYLTQEDVFVPAPFPQLCDELKGVSITATNASHSSGSEILGMDVANSAAVGLQLYQFRLPLPEVLPRQIDLFADIPALGSIDISAAPYESYLSDGSVISATPTGIVGSVTALDPQAAPAVSLVLDNYDSATPPVSLGITISVPASSSVFIRGLRLIID